MYPRSLQSCSLLSDELCELAQKRLTIGRVESCGSALELEELFGDELEGKSFYLLELGVIIS